MSEHSSTVGYPFAPIPAAVWDEGLDVNPSTILLFGYLQLRALRNGGGPQVITDKELLFGQTRHDGRRINHGCGIKSRNGLKAARDEAVALGWIKYTEKWVGEQLPDKVYEVLLGREESTKAVSLNDTGSGKAVSTNDTGKVPNSNLQALPRSQAVSTNDTGKGGRCQSMTAAVSTNDTHAKEKSCLDKPASQLEDAQKAEVRKRLLAMGVTPALTTRILRHPEGVRWSEFWLGCEPYIGERWKSRAGSLARCVQGALGWAKDADGQPLPAEDFQVEPEDVRRAKAERSRTASILAPRAELMVARPKVPEFATQVAPAAAARWEQLQQALGEFGQAWLAQVRAVHLEGQELHLGVPEAALSTFVRKRRKWLEQVHRDDPGFPDLRFDTVGTAPPDVEGFTRAGVAAGRQL